MACALWLVAGRHRLTLRRWSDNNRHAGRIEIDCFYVGDKELLCWWKRRGV